MEKPTKRRLRFLDLMILTAAIAVGIAVLPYYRPSKLGYDHSAMARAHLWRIYAAPPVMAVSVAAACIAFIPPRPRFRRLVRQPGFVGCVAASMSILVCVPFGIFLIVRLQKKGGLPPAYAFFELAARMLAAVASEAGLIVIGAWICLALSGRWKKGDHFDSFRFALCIGLIILFVSDQLIPFMF